MRALCTRRGVLEGDRRGEEQCVRRGAVEALGDPQGRWRRRAARTVARAQIKQARAAVRALAPMPPPRRSTVECPWQRREAAGRSTWLVQLGQHEAVTSSMQGSSDVFGDLRVRVFVDHEVPVDDGAMPPGAAASALQCSGKSLGGRTGLARVLRPALVAGGENQGISS